MQEAKKAGRMSASERDGVEYRTSKVWEIICAMISSGMTTGFYLLVTYASMAATVNFGVAVATAGLVITASSFIDATTDALAAGLFELFHPKKAKLRIFMFIGWVIASIGALLMFSWVNGRFSGVAGVVMFFIAYNVYRLGYTCIGTSTGVIPMILTNHPTQRPMLSVVGTLVSYFIPLVFMNVNTFIVLPKYNNQYNSEMFSEMVLWYLGITFVAMVISAIGIRRVDVAETYETVSVGKKKDDKVKVKDMVAVLKENKNVQMYMLAGISDKLAQNVSSQSMISTLLAGVLIGSYAATTMAGNVTQIVSLVFVFTGGVLIAKWGAKKATSVWSWVNIAVAVITVAYFLLLGGPNGMKQLGVMGAPIIIYAILLIAKTGSNMVLTTAGTAMRADITDYEYERSGKYMPAVVSGVYSFIDKIVNAFSSTIAAFCVALVGYTNSVPQMGDEATWPIFWMTMFLTFALPIIGWICNIIAMKFYTLDKERMVEVQKTLAERKAAAEAENA